MKKSLGFAGVALLVVTPVLAADLNRPPPPVYKAPPPPVPVFSWTGFYIGAHGGYGFGETSPKLQGGFGGGQIGYNYQVNNFLVLGIEGDGAGGQISASETTPDGVTAKFSDRALASVRARLGLAFGNALLYGTGGGGWADTSLSASALGMTISNDHWLSGWTAGGGVEYAFAPQWSAKLEYLRYGLTGQTFTLTSGNQSVSGNVPNFNIDTVKAGINYRF